MLTHDPARRVPSRKRGIPALLLAVSMLAAGAAAAADSAAQTTGGTAAAAPQTKVSAVASRHVLAGRTIVVKGSLRPGQSGRIVVMQVRRAGKWRGVARDRTSSRGAYRAGWRAPSTGRYALRARIGGTGIHSRTVRSTVYRPVQASWYGPGLYGNRLACGGRLGYGTVGVAHKSLPCGTKVTLRHRGRVATVRVIDRGPNVGNPGFDLTPATKRRLGFGSTGVVWSSR